MQGDDGGMIGVPSLRPWSRCTGVRGRAARSGSGHGGWRLSRLAGRRSWRCCTSLRHASKGRGKVVGSQARLARQVAAVYEFRQSLGDQPVPSRRALLAYGVYAVSAVRDRAPVWGTRDGTPRGDYAKKSTPPAHKGLAPADADAARLTG